MTRALFLCVAALCLLAIVGCGKTERRGNPIQVEVALPDMVAFDRAYIPALALTNGGDAAKAKKAVALLVARWQELRAKYMDAPTLNPQWRADFDSINAMILTADRMMIEGKPPQEAHGVLEGVRTVLKDLRLGYSISYDLDALTLFHEPMEAIALAVQGKTAAQLTQNDLTTIEEQWRYANSIWQGQVVKAPFDPALFQLSADQDARLREELRLETGIMLELKAALDAKDAARVIQSAAALKPHFATLYKLFGDFSGVQ
ncbi:MAG: hypothetical protein ACYDCO_07015 [Armatimonadota bacterium]